MTLTNLVRGRQHQISRGENYTKFYLLLLYDRRSVTSSHGFWGLAVWGPVGGWYKQKLVKSLFLKFTTMLFLITIRCCLPACFAIRECAMWSIPPSQAQAWQETNYTGLYLAAITVEAWTSVNRDFKYNFVFEWLRLNFASSTSIFTKFHIFIFIYISFQEGCIHIGLPNFHHNGHFSKATSIKHRNICLWCYANVIFIVTIFRSSSCIKINVVVGTTQVNIKTWLKWDGKLSGLNCAWDAWSVNM